MPVDECIHSLPISGGGEHGCLERCMVLAYACFQALLVGCWTGLMKTVLVDLIPRDKAHSGDSLKRSFIRLHYERRLTAS